MRLYVLETLCLTHHRQMRKIIIKILMGMFMLICEDFVLPTTCEMLLEYADDASEIDGGLREGLVFRSRDGKLSFKAVSNKFLEKYHG